MENTQAAIGDGGCVFRIINAQACGFNADKAYILILDKVVEHTHSIRATAYAGNQHIR